MKTTRKAACVALGALAALVGYASEARAEYPSPGFYVGLYGGYTLKLGDWDLGKTTEHYIIVPVLAVCWQRYGTVVYAAGKGV